jgi:hypothetical protein
VLLCQALCLHPEVTYVYEAQAATETDERVFEDPNQAGLAENKEKERGLQRLPQITTQQRASQ